MNKKFSTILTMVLLLVGALFSNANAKQLGAIGGEAKLANGVKFYLGNGGKYLKADPAAKFTDSSLKDIQFTTFNGALGTTDEATLFEVADYSFANNQSYFSLKVNGVYVYTEKGGVAKVSSKATDVTKVFRVKGNKIAGAALYADIAGAQFLANSNGSLNYGGGDKSELVPYNESATITAKDLNGLSEKVSLSFAIPTGTTLFEDNIFGQEMYAIQAPANPTVLPLAADHIYFLVGPADKLKAVKEQITSEGTLSNSGTALDAIKADGIQVVSLKKDKSYNIKNAPKGEGMQFVMEKGKDAFKTPEAAKNAGFVVSELDKTNNPGVYQLKMTPHTDIAGTVTEPVDLYVGAIRFTPSDAKSYITTVVKDNKSKLSLATNGISADLDASILLKSKAMNVVNIYFTSGKPSTTEELHPTENTEYHKYLIAASNGSTFELNALPLDKLNGFASPLSQWVVTGFNGHNTFTFTNREASANVKELNLTLLPTEVAGEYKIVSVSAPALVKNIYDGSDVAKMSLTGKTVKFNTIAATNPYLNLSKDEMKVAMSLNFSGKDATFGEKTFYGKFDDATDPTTYSPSAKEATADFYFAKVTDEDKKANYIQNVLTYAYLDGKAVKTAKDTLFVPSYTLKADGSDDKEGYLKSSVTTVGADTEAGEFVFRKNADGTYAMTVVNTVTELGKAKYSDFTAATKAISLNDDKTAFVNTTAAFFAMEDKYFASVTLVSADADRISLPAVPRHASFDNKLGSVSMQDANGINEGILKAEGLIFWLDTADSKATIPSFYISLGIPTKADAPAERMYMYNSADSLNLFNEGGAIQKPNEAYKLAGTNSNDAKAIFRAATITAIDTLTTTVDGKPAVVAKGINASKTVLGGIDNFKYNIFLADNDVEDEYVIYSKGQDVPQYLYSLNGKLGFTTDKKKALVVTLGKGTATSNEAISSASTVKVIAGNGEIQIIGAQGKNVIVANALGQTVANEVVSSDNATISVPAGFVIVNVEGEAFKALVK